MPILEKKKEKKKKRRKTRRKKRGRRKRDAERGKEEEKRERRRRKGRGEGRRQRRRKKRRRGEKEGGLDSASVSFPFLLLLCSTRTPAFWTAPPTVTQPLTLFTYLLASLLQKHLYAQEGASPVFWDSLVQSNCQP